MYDTFSSDYDRFVNWEARLAVELPFLEAQLQALSSRHGDQKERVNVLDAACGTGMHAIALAQRGYNTAGADLSSSMIHQARQNALAAGLKIRFETAGFGRLAEVFEKESFDALLCLGNSIPHVLFFSELTATLRDFAECLKPGGLLLIQNRNFDAVLSRKERWMEPQSYRQGEEEWIFLRFYDFEPDGLIQFNIVTLKREGNSPWTQRATSTRLYPWRQIELSQALSDSRFTEIHFYGSMAGEAFDPDKSGNLILTAKKRPITTAR